MPKFINHDDDEMFEDYVAQFDPTYDRQEHRRRKSKARYVPKKTQQEIIEELAEDTGIAGGFETTYTPSKHERGWLLQSLQTFYYQDLITDVEAQVKGGKEASVYRCTAHETTGQHWVAAKVYRPRQFRQLRNDAMYRQGRAAIGPNGKEVNAKDWRTLKAMNRGSGFGQALSHTSWLMYEYRTLTALHAAGAAVPQPFAVAENAVLMTYLGDENLPAPTLSEVNLQPGEAEPLFAEVMRNINLMLQQNIIHGDLSAYNILYWEGDIVLIDFPQVVDIQANDNAQMILRRDVTRVCEYFQQQGLALQPRAIADQLWDAYGKEADNPDEVLTNILEAVEYTDDDE